MVKSGKIVLATLLLTALYVVSVQRALGGRRHLYRVEPEMVAPAEARVAAVSVVSGKTGEPNVVIEPRPTKKDTLGSAVRDSIETLYYVLVKESFYDNLQDYKMWPAGMLLYGGEGVQKTDGPVCLDKTTRLAVFNHFNSYREALQPGQTYYLILGRPDGEGHFSNLGEAECIRIAL